MRISASDWQASTATVPSNAWRSRVLTITSCALLIAACNGADTKPVSTTTGPSGQQPTGVDGPVLGAEPGEGFWIGQMISDVTHEQRHIFALVDSWGWMRLITADAQYVGAIRRVDISSTRSDISVDLTGIASPGFGWANETSVSAFTLDGTISPATEISADYSGVDDSGSITLSLDPAGSRSVALWILDGMWASLDSNRNIRATFDINSGSLYGTDTDGCVFIGDIVADSWTSAYIYNVSLEIANCPDLDGTELNGNYLGSAGVGDIEEGSNRSDSLLIGVDNGQQAIMLMLEKI